MTLTQAIRAWPKPDASAINDVESVETFEARREVQKARHLNGNGMGPPLAIAVQQWATPKSSPSGPDHARAQRRMTHGSGADDLVTQVAGWDTPRRSDAGLDRGSSTGHGLRDQSRAWATPTMRDHKGSDLPNRVDTPSLSHQVERATMPPGQPSSSTTPTSPRRLNPRFSEWLMGWPEGWADTTSSPSSVTAWSRSARRLLSLILSGGSPPMSEDDAA